MKTLWKMAVRIALFGGIWGGAGIGQATLPLARLSADAVAELEMTPVGRALLTRNRDEWVHAETPHFVLHAGQNHQIYRAAEEAEFAWAELDTWFGPAPGGKANIFLVTDGALWRQLVAHYGWPPSSLAAHTGGDLFVLRARRDLSAQLAVPHELGHLRVYRLWGDGAPFCAEEGLAELLGWRLADAFHRKRYRRGLHRVFPPIPEARVLSWRMLAQREDYPEDPVVMQEHVQQIRRMAKSLLESGDEEKVQEFIAAFLQKRLPWPDGATRHMGLTPEELERLEQENRLRLMEEEREGWPQEVQADEALPPLQPRLISRP